MMLLLPARRRPASSSCLGVGVWDGSDGMDEMTMLRGWDRPTGSGDWVAVEGWVASDFGQGIRGFWLVWVRSEAFESPGRTSFAGRRHPNNKHTRHATALQQQPPGQGDGIWAVEGQMIPSTPKPIRWNSDAVRLIPTTNPSILMCHRRLVHRRSIGRGRCGRRGDEGGSPAPSPCSPPPPPCCCYGCCSCSARQAPALGGPHHHWPRPRAQ